MIHGSCLCRGVAWEVEGPLEGMTHCHCSRCRKAHGTAFATYVAGSSRTFRWLRGVDRIRRYASSPGVVRQFCSRCGSVVADEPGEERTFMPAGNLDEDPGTRPVLHIFAGSRAAWHEIRDDVAQLEAQAPGHEAPLAELDRDPPSRPDALRGSCLCGAAAYEVSGELRGIVLCHCSRCRKGRSSAHATNLFIKNPSFRWLSGVELVDGFRVPEAHRFMNHFCRICGGVLPRREPDANLVGIPAGSLDRGSEKHPGVAERIHIFVASKAPWYEIADDLPRVDERPPTT